MISVSIPDRIAMGSVKELDMLNECVLDHDKNNLSDLDLLIDIIRHSIDEGEE